ncbi:PREDICTED: transcription factor TGA2.2-like [Ipomoea nil]|uniref:transcription factor TGA2.2-like n=1 Tax=Ipomoea nil TaxID=35883 RepID=UPI000900D191|nr:PREDICTED: transcription factor TGA2.2-like [Ipomoea nil]
MMGSENNINGNDDNKLLLGVGVPFMAAASGSKTNQVSVAQPPPFQDPAALNNHTFLATMQLPSSSPPPGNSMNKDNNGAYDLGELDQEFLLFLGDAQAQDPSSSSHDQRRRAENYDGMRPPNTLNIFPSQPMHVNPSSTAEAIAGLVVSPDTPEASNRPSLPLMELSNLKNKAVVASASASDPPKPLKLEASGSRRGSTSSGDRHWKTLRRLAQNREAARRSRLRKKAYIQQLEESRITLIQLEQQVARAIARGVRISENGSIVGAQHGHPLSMTKITPEAAAFEMEYGRWVEEQHGMICELRNAVIDEHASEIDLKRYVDACFAHYAKMTHLKSTLAKSDVLYLVSGMCWTPVERCFIWIAGFRPSQLLKVIMRQLELVTEQQVLGMIALQQSTQEAEEALSQGMEALNQTISDIISSDNALFYPSNLGTCMGQMAAAITNLCTLETFVRQADHLRTQTLQRLYQILTIRQVATCFLIIADYFHRLRALSSLWLGRPRLDI